MAKVIITFPRDPAKGTTIEVDGWTGSGCQKLTEGLERALGKTVKDELKDEFHEVSQQQDQHELQ